MSGKCDWCEKESEHLRPVRVDITTAHPGRDAKDVNTTIDHNLCVSCSIRLDDAIESASSAIADACHPSHEETILEFNRCGVFRVDPDALLDVFEAYREAKAEAEREREAKVGWHQVAANCGKSADEAKAEVEGLRVIIQNAADKLTRAEIVGFMSSPSQGMVMDARDLLLAATPAPPEPVTPEKGDMSEDVRVVREALEYAKEAAHTVRPPRLNFEVIDAALAALTRIAVQPGAAKGPCLTVEERVGEGKA